MDVDAIRAQIPLTRECIYFNTGGIAPALAPVTEVLVNECNDIAQHGPPLIMDNQRHSERLQEARRQLAAFCGIDAADLCLTRGVADGVAGDLLDRSRIGGEGEGRDGEWVGREWKLETAGGTGPGHITTLRLHKTRLAGYRGTGG